MVHLPSAPQTLSITLILRGARAVALSAALTKGAAKFISSSENDSSGDSAPYREHESGVA